MKLSLQDKRYIISQVKNSDYKGSYLDLFKKFEDGGPFNMSGDIDRTSPSANMNIGLGNDKFGAGFNINRTLPVGIQEDNTSLWKDIYGSYSLNQKNTFSTSIPLNYKSMPTFSYDRTVGKDWNLGVDVIPSQNQSNQYAGIRLTKQFKDGGQMDGPKKTYTDSLKLYKLNEHHGNENYTTLSGFSEKEKIKYISELNQLYPGLSQQYSLSLKTGIMPEGYYSYGEMPGLKFKKPIGTPKTIIPNKIIEEKKPVEPIKPAPVLEIQKTTQIEKPKPPVITPFVRKNSTGTYGVYDNQGNNIKSGFTKDEALKYATSLQKGDEETFKSRPKYWVGGFTGNTSVNGNYPYNSNNVISYQANNQYGFGGRYFQAESNHPDGNYYTNGKRVPKWYYGGPVVINRKEKENYGKSIKKPII